MTRIVSMSNRDRRGLIDELAGVALFDTRIEQTRRKLDDVQERQERCRIIEQELLAGRQRLEKDCAKARQYQELRERLQLGRRQEQVLVRAGRKSAQAARRPPTDDRGTGAARCHRHRRSPRDPGESHR